MIKGDLDEDLDILLLERTFTSGAKDFMAVKVGETKKILASLDFESNTQTIRKQYTDNSKAIHRQFESNTQTIVEMLIETFDTMLRDYQEQARSSEERHVTNFVEAVYAKLFGKEGRASFLFVHRGIGPLDSSLSDKMTRGKQNYEDTV